MTIPANIDMAGSALEPTYSGDIATSRRVTTFSDGNKRQLDIIQSLPAKGRQRHVVRMQFTSPVVAATGLAPSTSFTLTMDHPFTDTPAAVADLLGVFLTAMGPYWDEVAAGQQ